MFTCSLSGGQSQLYARVAVEYPNYHHHHHKMMPARLFELARSNTSSPTRAGDVPYAGYFESPVPPEHRGRNNIPQRSVHSHECYVKTHVTNRTNVTMIRSESNASIVSIDRTAPSSPTGDMKNWTEPRMDMESKPLLIPSSGPTPELCSNPSCDNNNAVIMVTQTRNNSAGRQSNKSRQQPGLCANLHVSLRPGSGRSSKVHVMKRDNHVVLEKSLLKKRQVYVCVVFLKIGEIDTIKEQYAADVLIKSKWREPALDHQTDLQDFDWSISWAPKLYIENTIGEAKEHVYQMITFNEYGHAFLCEKRRVSGIFLENLELNHFPFDVQDLTITVASNLTTADIRLVNDPDEPHRINKQSFVDEQEWYLYKHIETEQRELIYEYTDPTSVRPALSVKCRAARRPAYFIWNIFLVTFLICSLSLVTFAVDKKNPHNRLQLTFTLVLTLVAFKFIVNQCLPKISYLTYLDKYVISSLLLLTMVTVWHGLIVVVEKVVASLGRTIPDDMELYVIIGMTMAFAGFNAGFVFMIYKVACKRRRDMKQRDKEYVEKVQVQMKAKVHRNMKMVQQTHQLHEVRENGTTSFI